MNLQNDDPRISIIASAFNNCCKTRHISKHIKKYARKTAPPPQPKTVNVFKAQYRAAPRLIRKPMKEKCPYCKCTIKTTTEEALIKHYTHCSMFFD